MNLLLPLVLVLASATSVLFQQSSTVTTAAANDELWEASRAGDVARAAKALDQGADVNAKTRYGATALTFAADRGHLDLVKLLIDRGADVNVQDSFYRMRPVDSAMMNRHTAVARLLLARGSRGGAGVLMRAIQLGDLDLARAAANSSDVTRANIAGAIAAARRTGNQQLVAMLTAKLDSMPSGTAPPPVSVNRATLESYVGTYRNSSSGMTITVALAGEQLTVSTPGQPPLTLAATSATSFRAVEFDGLTLTFAGRAGTIERLVLAQNGSTQSFERTTAEAAAAATGTKPTPAVSAADVNARRTMARTAPRPWPGFRGQNAAGNGDGQGAAVEWDVDTGQNIRWKTPIPGISNSSPVVWGDRVFVVTAISSAGDKTFRTGVYGDVAPVNDLSEHTWKLYCLDKTTGRIVWERTAFTGVPKVKRHTKASQANSTPVTDGRRVIALFGSIGKLFAWSVDGRPLWAVDVGVLDSGWFFDPEYQWGHSSSPIIYRTMVIVQADRQKGSFIAAYDLESGKEVWRTLRDEIPTWGTPTIFRANGRDQIVTNGPKIRAYDGATGKLLWTPGPNSEVTVGTPIEGEGLIYVTGGYPPARPIYAVKPTASGDITLTKENPASEALAWSNDREGTYIPTPLYYAGILYTCGNNGILTAYDARTGERIYRARVGGGGSFSASPVAADGRLYLANEDGDVFVIGAGRTYEELAKNEMKEVVMSTPAVSDGTIVLRTLGHVYGIGEPARR